MLQVDDATLGAAANRAGYVQGGGFWGAAREDERFERVQLGVAVVDGEFQFGYALFVYAGFNKVVLHLGEVRGGQNGTYREEIALYGDEDFVNSWHHLDRANQSERCV